MNSVQRPCSPSTMSFHSSVDRVPAQYLGDHGFDSCRGLRFFLCSMLVLCWSLHFSRQITIFIEESNQPWVGFYVGPLALLNWNLQCWFCGGMKTRETGEKPLEQAENGQDTQPIYGMGLELNLGHMSGRCRALSPLDHSCFQQNLD